MDHQEPNGPLLSVVVTSFNYGQYLLNALASLQAQTFKALEIIVVDGGSTDNTSRQVAVSLDRRNFRVLLRGEPHRVGDNRNYGIARARGRFICCLDADDELRPTYFEKALFLLQKYNFDVVSSAMETFGESAERIDILERPSLGSLLKGNHVLTSAVFRRTYWSLAGGFKDSDLDAVGHVHEDWLFWARLAALGARFINLARDPMLLYRVHQQSLSRSPLVVPMDVQREHIRTGTLDVVTQSSLDRSRRDADWLPATPISPREQVVLMPTGAGTSYRGSVILALPFMILGGAERLLSSIIEHLSHTGWRVTIVTSIDPGTENGDTTDWFERGTAEIFHLPRCLSREYWDDFLRHVVQSRNATVLWIVGSVFAYDNVRTLKHAFPSLKILDLHFNTVGHVQNHLRRRAQIDMTVVENEEVRSWLIARGGDPNKIRLIQSGVDVDRLRPELRTSARYDVTSTDVLIGYCGRWSSEKDPLAFVEIARRLAHIEGLRFVMTGDGPLRSKIVAAVSSAKFASGKFQLMGNIPDISATLAALDILVLPSKVDGRPIVVQEALAVGTPVLASRVGDLSVLVSEGATGWLAEPGDISGFVQILRTAVADKGKLTAMRIAARAHAENFLDRKHMFAGYEQLLQELA